MAKTYLFDIGDVLWFYRSSLKKLLEHWAKIDNVTYEEMYTDYKSYYKQLETNQLTLPNRYLPAVKQIYTEENFQEHLNQPLLDYIGQLRKTNQVGFLSNAENFFYPYIQQKFLPYFDFGYASWELGIEKPDPQIYFKTLELQHLQPKDVIFIDDTPKNIIAAQNIGIQSVIYVTNSSLIRELNKHRHRT